MSATRGKWPVSRTMPEPVRASSSLLASCASAGSGMLTRPMSWGSGVAVNLSEGVERGLDQNDDEQHGEQPEDRQIGEAVADVRAAAGNLCLARVEDERVACRRFTHVVGQCGKGLIHGRTARQREQ